MAIILFLREKKIRRFAIILTKMQNIQNDQRHVCEHTCKSSQKKIQNYKFKGSFFNFVFNIIIKSVNYSVKFLNL